MRTKYFGDAIAPDNVSDLELLRHEETCALERHGFSWARDTLATAGEVVRKFTGSAVNF